MNLCDIMRDQEGGFSERLLVAHFEFNLLSGVVLAGITTRLVKRALRCGFTFTANCCLTLRRSP